MIISEKIAEELKVKVSQVDAAVRLIDEGNTIPFISRYRKEATGGLNDEQLRTLDERLRYLRSLEEKKEQVIASIREQGKLTSSLEKEIRAAETMVAVEDLYRPYRPKRKTRAGVARERGLEPLAAMIWEQKLSVSPEEAAVPFVNPAKEVSDVAAALAGAGDILAENISDTAAYRSFLRNAVRNCGSLVVSAAKGAPETSVYEMYYAFEESFRRISGHQILAINRGEKEKVLQVRLEMEEAAALRYLENQIIRPSARYTTAILKDIIRDSYRRLIAPAIERELRNELTEKAEEGAIRVFAKNLEQLLMQPPITGHVVLGWDPAFRTGCKLAVVDATGKVLDTVVIYPTAPQNRVSEAKRTLKQLIDRYHITLVSLGNGTASRESEQVLTEFLHESGRDVSYVIVNEAGASVYSASKLATEEFPNFDVGQRSAASIARRLQDPLAELVKIDPASIGVGQYQHDMNQKKMSETLKGVVEDCVNRVGIDLNTASAPLLSYVSGISGTVAKNIVAYREANGSFHSRAELKKVPKLGPRAFEQCAGFLRVREGREPLDNTAVHPESYGAAEKLLRSVSLTKKDLGSEKLVKLLHGVRADEALAAELGIGRETLKDILEEIKKPGRDPRADMPAPLLRKDVLDLKDLKEGMELTGTVRNVIDFGAFVDIGVHQDGLVHISQLCDRYVKNPMDVVRVGDVVRVRVLSVDIKKKRIALTMKGVSQNI